MNRVSRALSTLCLSAAFAAASFAQAQSPAPLPDAPTPQPAAVPAKPGFIPRAIDFFNTRTIDRNDHMYDFAMQQPLFPQLLAKKGLGLAIEGGTLTGNFGNVKLNTDRDNLRAVMGIKSGDPCTLCSAMFPSNNDTRHGDGFAVGLRLTFGH
jgi:hypothetical protein